MTKHLQLSLAKMHSMNHIAKYCMKMLIYLIKFTFVFSFDLTFLHLARAIIVIKLPGKPTNINTMHVAEANVNKPDEYPSNRGISARSRSTVGKSVW